MKSKVAFGVRSGIDSSFGTLLPPMSIQARTWWLARLLGCDKSVVTVEDRQVTVATRTGTHHYLLEQVQRLDLRRSGMWASLHCELASGQTVICRGLGTRNAKAVIAAAELLKRDARRAELLDQYQRPYGRDVYLTHSMHARWIQQATLLVTQGLRPLPDGAFSAAVERFLLLARLVRDGEQARTARNNAHAQRMAAKHAALFQHGLGYPLNEQQIEAIVHDEDRALIVAGAGTGKTSTIVGKAAFLLRDDRAKPEEILLLAFTNKAVDEMRDRLTALGHEAVTVSTFHKLGNQIIAHSTGAKPTLSKLADDNQSFKNAIGGILTGMLDAAGDSTARDFLLLHRYPTRPIESFATPHMLHQHVAGHGVRTLRGEKVKSMQECQIADWLTSRGIKYEYERPYPHPTASVAHRQYQPDFTLTDHNLFIEHFGIGHGNKPAPCFGDPSQYLRQMQWKRDLHKKHGTVLIETFSHQAADGTLFESLEAALKKHNVPVAPVSADQLASELKQEHVIGPGIALLSSFLNLFKGNDWSIAELEHRLSVSPDERARRFVALFRRVLERYEVLLSTEGAIDFNDMIRKAAALVRNGQCPLKFKYILVDEFQDISRGRARLLQALLGSEARARLFAVGDDWQSIYRFTGSDIDLMVRFADHFGYTRRTDIQTTYRFTDKLLQASAKFILTNPQQLRKELMAQHQTLLPPIEVISVGDGASSAAAKTSGGLFATDPEEAQRLAVIDALDQIASSTTDEQVDVLLLGRYSFTSKVGAIQPKVKRISLRSMTVHAAKGLEAEYTIVLDVVGGRYGFPTEIVDDPLLELVLAGKMAIANAEERRLFYVALTRARRKAFVATRDSARSVFVDELEGPDYKGLVIPSGARDRTVACPSCQGGRLLRREGQWGVFWGCSNFPGCVQKARTCPWCGVGAFVARSIQYVCANPECKKTAKLCPRCGVGAVVPKNGKFGPFWGCTEWRSEPPSCGFTSKHA